MADIFEVKAAVSVAVGTFHEARTLGVSAKALEGTVRVGAEAMEREQLRAMLMVQGMGEAAISLQEVMDGAATDGQTLAGEAVQIADLATTFGNQLVEAAELLLQLRQKLSIVTGVSTELNNRIRVFENDAQAYNETH